MAIPRQASRAPAAPGLYPMAYYLTINTYGTWLPGDPRGWVLRRRQGRGAIRMAARPGLERSARARMASRPVSLRPVARIVVGRAIREVCAYRGWTILAAAVQARHVHVVVAARATPSKVTGDLKARAGRRLVEAGLMPRGARIWARRGCMSQVLTHASLMRTIRYVNDPHHRPATGG